MLTNGMRFLSASQFSFLKRTAENFDPDEWSEVVFDNNLAEWRLEKGLKQVDLSRKLHDGGFDFSSQLIGEIETGKKKPSLEFMYALCFVFGVSMDRLFFQDVYDGLSDYQEVVLSAKKVGITPDQLEIVIEFLQKLGVLHEK